MTPYQKYKKAAELRRDRVIALHKEGFIQEDIAKKVKITRQRVGQILSDFRGKRDA